MRTRLFFFFAVAVFLFFGLSPTAWAAALAYTVTSTSDGDLVGPSTQCEDGTGHCTLRAAITASNLHSGDEAILFNIPASDPGYNGAFWTIRVSNTLPDLAGNVSINGPGANLLTVTRPDNSGGLFRIFRITSTGTVSISGITVSNGSFGGNPGPGAGMDITAGGTVNITNCVFSDNSSTGQPGPGGAISNDSNGTLNIAGTVFATNHGTRGGAIENANTGVVTVTTSTFSGNTGFQGGAIDNGSTGTFTVSSSTFTGNTYLGGVIYQAASGTLNVTNCTLSGNTDSSTSDSAGAIGNKALGTVNVSNCTISGNNGVGLSNTFNGAFNVRSTIVASNSNGANPAQDVFGTFNSGGFNLIGRKDASSGFNAPSDQTGTSASPLDPKLDPNGLQNNGGPTQTIALLFGSPAIDKGTAGFDPITGMPLTTDQRGAGFTRTFNDPAVTNAPGGDGSDIGAFEVQTIPPTRLANVATRLKVETGDNVLFGGFIVTGTQPKKVIIRALGPSVQAPGVLADPTLELYQGNTLLEANDNWVDSPNKQAIIDSTVQPPNNLESAIVRSLPANTTAYTAIVRGVNDGTGIGVVEVYDLDSSVDSKLANISTRGLVQTGDDVLIAGTIVVGEADQKVLVCALGPSLPVQGNLADPTLELRDNNGMLLEANDNWIDSPNKQAIAATGAAPTNNLESAIIHTVSANGAIYTAIVRGANNGTGVALVEVFALN